MYKHKKLEDFEGYKFLFTEKESSRAQISVRALGAVLTGATRPGATRLILRETVYCFEMTYPRYIHPEIMSYRAASRNSASSRAIPSARLLSMARNNPVLPVFWTRNQGGMSGPRISGPEEFLNDELRRSLARTCTDTASELMNSGVHKQDANRLIEPFLPTQTLLTIGEKSLVNLLNQRLPSVASLDEPLEAQPDFACLAEHLLQATAGVLQREFLVPYVGYTGDAPTKDEVIRSVESCARLTAGTKHSSSRQPGELFKQLWESGHLSPFEHVVNKRCNLRDYLEEESNVSVAIGRFLEAS